MYTLKKQTRTILFIVFSIAIAVLIGLIALELYMPDVELVKESLLKGTGVSTMAYTVHLKENPVTDEREMKQGQYYLKPFVDYLDVTCDFQLDTDHEATFVLNDKIDVILVSQVGTDEETKVIWEKVYAGASLLETTDAGQSIASNRSIRLRFDNYDALVNSLIEEYDLVTDYAIKVVYDGTVNIEYNGIAQEEKFSSYITIPFTNPIIEVGGAPDGSREISIDQDVQHSTAPDLSLLILYGAAIFVCIGIILIVRFKTQALAREDAYSKKVADIFKEYGNRLAGLSEALFYQSSVMISIDKIEDIVKIADEIGQTVFYYRVDDEAERKIEFYVFDEGRIYYMVLFGSL
ncbi:MAG TPA: DUF5305 family protein [Negativicutes bacterium]|nr:DUF5305 family protein [Negativicutes bacterium]